MIRKLSQHWPYFILIAFTGLLLSFRIYYSGSIAYLFLVWNLFLAWIPLFIVSYLEDCRQNAYLQALLLTTWLLFFPNSLYIITDFVHLKQWQNIPLWFDAILLFSATLNGMMMAYASVIKIESYLRSKFSLWKSNTILFSCFFLSSFGIYLGRFLRLNSWDIITHPFYLSTEILHRLFFPFDHLRTWGITIILTVFFSLFYFTTKKIPGFIIKSGNNL